MNALTFPSQFSLLFIIHQEINAKEKLFQRKS